VIHGIGQPVAASRGRGHPAAVASGPPAACARRCSACHSGTGVIPNAAHHEVSHTSQPSSGAKIIGLRQLSHRNSTTVSPGAPVSAIGCSCGCLVTVLKR
jgi:hypothetical protein